ncbi:MAG: HlyD family efflux transporter periplasmic adaptor subunit, partial [Planctomycetota bacterium]
MIQLTKRSLPFSDINSLFSYSLIGLLAIAGCRNNGDEFPAKAPRPVTTFRLVKSTPQSPSQVTGSVESWKTEQIGFEIPGKLEWVLEPGKNIEPQVSNSDGAELKPGTPLAQIDATQFDVAVRNAKASVDVAKRNLEVAQISLTDSIPEQIKSAQADLDFAKTEYERYKKLVVENAVSQTATDQTKNRYEVQVARMTNLLSSKKQAEAEVQAADARLRSAGLALENAERDLKNTTLYASFGGQIESVDVVPGSIVSAGSPIMKLQMMNPIKIDIEVSAQQSRQLQRNRQAAISYELPDGGRQTSRGMLYQVNPSADASTRTFTATFLIFNEQRRPELPESLKSLPLARTSEFWPLKVNEIIKGRPGNFMIEEGAIETEGEESWVWMAKDIVRGDPLPPFLSVERKKVSLGTTRIPFLGNWMFREVAFADSAVNSENMIVGSLQFPDTPRDK